MVEMAARMGRGEALRELRPMPAFGKDAPAEGVCKLLVDLRDPIATGENAFRQDFGGRARSCGADVGDKIGDCEIGFVADGGNDGNGGIENGAGHTFFVEGPKILQAPAAPCQENRVKFAGRRRGKFVEKAEGVGYFTRGIRALNRARDEDDLEGRIAALDDVENVMYRGAGRGRNEADSIGKGREDALPLLGEKPFGCEFLFEPFKRGLERAHSLRFNREDVQLVLTARFIDGQFAFENYPPAVLDRLAPSDRFGSKDNTTNLGESVLKREINVAGALDTAICDFSTRPKRAEMAFEQAADVRGQFADGKYATRDFRRKKFASEIPL